MQNFSSTLQIKKNDVLQLRVPYSTGTFPVFIRTIKDIGKVVINIPTLYADLIVINLCSISSIEIDNAAQENLIPLHYHWLK